MVAPALSPDLVTLRLHQADMAVATSGKRRLLAFSNVVGNRGTGPLELRPSAVSNDCDGDGNPDNDRDAIQRTYGDVNGDGVFEREIDTAYTDGVIGCEHYEPSHHHWHLLDFARYKLRRLWTGKVVARSTKISFCLVDTEHWLAALPGSPKQRYYPVGGPTCDSTTFDGISVGWADVYGLGLPGQELDVTGLPRARYCLVSRADPSDRVTESRDDNNVRRTRLRVDPAGESVKRLPGPCRRAR